MENLEPTKKILGMHAIIEVEYVAMTDTSKEMLCHQGLLTKWGFKQEKNVLCSRSKSAI